MLDQEKRDMIAWVIETLHGEGHPFLYNILVQLRELIDSSVEKKKLQQVINTLEEKSLSKGADPNCPKCHGDGSYMYDEIHGKICERCCDHSEGYIDFHSKYPTMYAEDGYEYCKKGCGHARKTKASK